MSNSNLVVYKKMSPNNSGKRQNKISRITPHCVVGQLSVETLGNLFARSSTQASSNYGIGKDGRVGLYVNESDRSWCSSSRDNDNRAVTIECASEAKHPYKFNDAVYKTLVVLCVDICKRNGKSKLLWFGDKKKTLSYDPKDDEMVLTVHRWFANKSCPGDWMMARMDDLAAEVTKQLKKEVIYRVCVGTFNKKKSAEGMKKVLSDKGYKGFVAPYKEGYTVQVGSYKKKSNAEKMVDDMKKSGYVGKIVKA